MGPRDPQTVTAGGTCARSAAAGWPTTPARAPWPAATAVTRPSTSWRPAATTTVEEHEFLATLPTDRGHTWELPSERRLACQGCGAGFTLPPAQSTASCPFCEFAPRGRGRARPGELIAPEAILPFAVDAAEARRAVRCAGCAARRRPGRAGQQGRGWAPKPVYMPFWTFSVMGEVTWQGALDRRTRTSTRPSPARSRFWPDNFLVPASHRLPQGVLAGADRLGPGRPGALLARPAGRLAGGDLPDPPGRRLAGGPPAGPRTGHAGRPRRLHRRGRQVHGLSYDSSGVVVDSFKLVLLPVWIACFRSGRQGICRGRQRADRPGPRPDAAQRAAAAAGRDAVGLSRAVRTADGGADEDAALVGLCHGQHLLAGAEHRLGQPDAVHSADAGGARGGRGSKNTALGGLRAASLAVAILVQAAFGLLSDRSTLRWGRRRPFIVAGTLLDLVLLVLVGVAGLVWQQLLAAGGGGDAAPGLLQHGPRRAAGPHPRRGARRSTAARPAASRPPSSCCPSSWWA